MEGEKGISPVGVQFRMLVGAVISFGKEIFGNFRSYLDTESYLTESKLLNAELPKFQGDAPEFVKKARREKSRSSSPPPKAQPNSEFSKRRDSVRPSSPPKGRIHAKALKR